MKPCCSRRLGRKEMGKRGVEEDGVSKMRQGERWE